MEQKSIVTVNQLYLTRSTSKNQNQIYPKMFTTMNHNQLYPTLSTTKNYNQLYPTRSTKKNHSQYYQTMSTTKNQSRKKKSTFRKSRMCLSVPIPSFHSNEYHCLRSKKKVNQIQLCWYMHVSSALQKWKQKDYFNVSLSYTQLNLVFKYSK